MGIPLTPKRGIFRTKISLCVGLLKGNGCLNTSCGIINLDDFCFCIICFCFLSLFVTVLTNNSSNIFYIKIVDTFTVFVRIMK